MAFTKTGISISKPRAIENPGLLLQPGDEREGKVWDGKRWVAEEEWLASKQQKSG
jgi:hypothetical protein